MTAITRTDFALHAPPVPQDFYLLRLPIIVDQVGGFKRVVQGTESELDRIVRWRLTYADAMIKELGL